MTQETFTDNLLIDGSRDVTQLTVEGHSIQDEALQTWQNAAQTPLAKVTGDGRLQIGDFEPAGTMATDDALIEAHRDGSSIKPMRGLHVSGVVDEQADAVAWSVHELDVSGTNTDLTEAVALRTVIYNDGNGSVDTAIGLQVVDVEQADRNYAIHTGVGTTHLGDDLELKVQSTTPADNPPTDFIKVYPKLVSGEPHLYTKDATGTERELAGGSTTFPVQNANVVFAGPPSGNATAPAFRTLVAGDIPSLDAAKITSGMLDNARINWAAPGAIGTSLPGTGVFLSVTTTASAGGALILNGTSDPSQVLVQFRRNNNNRWRIGTDGGPESGSNTGSNFAVLRHADNGTFIDTPLSIVRSTGVVNVPNANIGGGSINGTSIGNSVPTTGRFTSINSSAGVTLSEKPLSGPVTSVSSSDARVLLYDYGSGNWSGIGTDVNGNFWVRAGTTTPNKYFVFTNTGQMGIGINTPSATLDIFGTARISTGTTNNVCIGGGMLSGQKGIEILYDPAANVGEVRGHEPGVLWRPLVLQRFGGYVGIGIIPAFQLHLSTDNAAKPGNAFWTVSSDRRMKRNIRLFKQGLEFLRQLPRAQRFEYNGAAGTPEGKEYVGFVAQELQAVAPSWVQTLPGKLNPDDVEETDLLYVNSGELNFVLMNAVLELADRVDALEKVS
jgi:hypothetical protein